MHCQRAGPLDLFIGHHNSFIESGGGGGLLSCGLADVNRRGLEIEQTS